MKEATGEGSMTVITIIVIAALAVAATVLVGYFLTKTKTEASNVTGGGVKTQNNLDGMIKKQ